MFRVRQVGCRLQDRASDAEGSKERIVESVCSERSIEIQSVAFKRIQPRAEDACEEYSNSEAEVF